MPLMNRPRVVINGTRRTRTYRFFWCRQCDRTVRIASATSSNFICPFCYTLLFQELHLSTPSSSNLLSHNSDLSSSSVSPAQLLDTMSQIINLQSPDDHPILRPRLTVHNPRPESPQEYGLSRVADPEQSDQTTTEDQTAENRTCSGIAEVRMTADKLCTEPTCPVCKEEFVIHEKVTKLGCNHLYHRDCIMPWLQINSTCPVCRYELPTQQGSHHHDYNTRVRSTGFRAANHGYGYDFGYEYDYDDYNLHFEEVMNLSWPSWGELFSFVWPFRVTALLDWSFPS